MFRILLLGTIGLLLVVGGCDAGVDPEGDDVGECDDGMDNDQDGLTDCYDPGCANASDCDVSDDDTGDDDTGGDDDDTTPHDDDDTGDDDDDVSDDDDTGTPCSWDGLYSGDTDVVVDNPMMGTAYTTCTTALTIEHCVIDGEMECDLPPFSPLTVTGEISAVGLAEGDIDGFLQYVGQFNLDWTGSAGGGELQGSGIYYYGLLTVTADFDLEL